MRIAEAMTELSIVIPYFNAASFLERTLEAIKQQVVVNYELIVVDDGSDTMNKNVLMANQYQIDVLLTQENQGQASARNAGIRKAKGEYILNWDADDYFEPTFCYKAIQIFEADPEVKIVTCEALRTSNGVTGDYIKPIGGTYKNFLFENSALGSAMFKKADWKQVGGYDEAQKLRGFEDWDFYLRILYPCGRAFVIPEQLFTYTVHSESTTSRIILNDLSLERREYIYLKNQDIYGENYSLLIKDLFNRLFLERKERYKNFKRKEFVLGSAILKPLKLLKRLKRR